MQLNCIFKAPKGLYCLLKGICSCLVHILKFKNSSMLLCLCEFKAFFHLCFLSSRSTYLTSEVLYHSISAVKFYDFYHKTKEKTFDINFFLLKKKLSWNCDHATTETVKNFSFLLLLKVCMVKWYNSNEKWNVVLVAFW